MSALGQKQTFAVHQPMSALPPKADMCSALAYDAKRKTASRRSHSEFGNQVLVGFLVLVFFLGTPSAPFTPPVTPPMMPCALATTGTAKTARTPATIHPAFMCFLHE